MCSDFSLKIVESSSYLLCQDKTDIFSLSYDSQNILNITISSFQGNVFVFFSMSFAKHARPSAARFLGGG